ncbi:MULTISPECIES: hypothetical protein [Streptomyces]|uniref:Uncharacterized protein n=1 Tax=Streptomyces flaveolus TaxID=67297 RepID=A0ABV3AAA8_9ACTN|nr:MULTISPECIES: hypothetical protein [Streptomyces]
MPTLNREMTTVVSLYLVSLLKGETISLVELNHPRHPFTEAATPPSAPAREREVATRIG